MTMVSEIAIPSLEIAPLTGNVGTIRWALRAASRHRLADSSPREPLTPGQSGIVELASAEKFFIGEAVPSVPYTGCTGTILRSASDGLRWHSHTELESTRDRINNDGWDALHKAVRDSWADQFRYRSEVRDAASAVTRIGLRPPQIGALHAIATHWSLYNLPATIVMPTGTGKTETMLATMVSQVAGRVLVVVPTRALRAQTVDKFLTLGLLRELGAIPAEVRNPIVGIVEHRPLQASDWDFLDPCHVIVATIGTVAQGTAADYLPDLVKKCAVLIIDEAHHVAADTWTTLRDAFAGKPVLQFTATPYRRDGKPVDGQVIYNYPLHRAQSDGYFQPIRFTPIFEIDRDDGDEAIAAEAIRQLEEDRASGLDHIVMARCDTKERAKAVFALYESLASAHAPVLVYSGAPNVRDSLDAVRSRKSRVVVCVDMLGEGFDLPQLKIAAVHDTHKSLAVLLQFVGRFTRTSGAAIGGATVVANIANQDLSAALERLYSEDTDWNKLLSEYSSDAIKDHIALSEFLRKCERMGLSDGKTDVPLVAPKALFPRLSAVVFECQGFYPDKFHAGLPKNTRVECEWVNRGARVLFFLTRSEPRVQWSTAQSLRERVWDLYVLYYSPSRKLLFVHSTSRESLHEDLASAVTKGTSKLVSGDTVFRCLGNISRLILLNIGLRRHARRNIRFSMHTGSDVASALNPTQTSNSTKSNLFGSGFEGGRPTNVGCSYKGRIWSRDYGTIQEFTQWCDALGGKLVDKSIKTDTIIANVLIPKQVATLPDLEVLCLDWPRELLTRTEEGIFLDSRYGRLPLSQYSIELVSYDRSTNAVIFRVVHDTHAARFEMLLRADGFGVRHLDGEQFTYCCGRLKPQLEEWLAANPPCILFVDGSELDGCDYIAPTVKPVHQFPSHRITAWDWAGTDIEKESMWKDGVFRTDSVQHRAMTEQVADGFTVVFDDDSAGEVADLVCMRENADAILVRLLHCKFSGEPMAGKRVKDAVEVCSQAVRSSRWVWRFGELCRRLLQREVTLTKGGGSTRFHAGDAKAVNRLAKASRFKTVRTEIVIVQPGIRESAVTADQAMVLNAAHAYLMETVNIPLTVICNS